jgi:predicted porin
MLQLPTPASPAVRSDRHPESPRASAPSRRSPGARRAAQRLRRGAVALACAVLSLPAAAVDFGPFSLTGFVKVEATRGTNVCKDCQREAGENRQRQWADDIIYGQRYGTEGSTLTLVQPYLGYKQDIGRGFTLHGLLSQRWRDGMVDLPGWLFERNVGISHEDYGRLTIGAMPTRSWAVADFPYGTNVGVSDAWGSSGAGYGLLSRAVRYMTRRLDVLEGDLVLEATYDMGKSGWTRNKPAFLELYAQYVKGDLVVDAMVQSARNGEPVGWGKAPFGGLTPFSQDDPLLGGSSQGIAMLMARYQVDARIEVSGGIRFNRWSGAYAVQTTPGPLGRWNSMFNVDWGGTRDGVANPGYSARSTDLMLGARYRFGQWTASTGLVYLGEASTANPSERGQGNSLLMNTLGLGYDVGNGLQLYGLAGMVHYGRRGLAPLSMPSHSAFSNVDSRVATRGNWFGAGAVFTY